MALSKRAPALGLAVVALALTLSGVVFAAADSNPSGGPKDPLVLNGYPPKSAQLHVTISTGQAYNVTGDVNVNFLTNAVEAKLQIPLFFSATQVDLRLVGKTLYGQSANLSSMFGSTWLAASASQPSLYGLALEMTRPDISLISGFSQEAITHQGYDTTYSYHRDNVAITAPSGLPVNLPTRAAIDFTITLGSQGELVASSFTVTSKTSTATISGTVLSYNQPADITAPPASAVKKIDAATLQKLFGSTAITSLLSPTKLTALGQIRLN